MITKYLINKNEAVVGPFDSIDSVERLLLEKEYLVVKDKSKYEGIVTQADVIQKGHNLVIDCVTPKPKINEYDDVEKVFHIMYKEKKYILPVFDSQQEYLGSVMLTQIMKELSYFQNIPKEIKITNIIGSADTEIAKQAWINELSHNIKNPIQVIYSSISLYKTAKKKKERDLLIDTIDSSAKRIDDIVNKLFWEYFPP